MRFIAMALLSLMLMQAASAQDAPAMPHSNRVDVERQPTMSCQDRLEITTRLLENYREQIKVLKAELAAITEKEDERAADADTR